MSDKPASTWGVIDDATIAEARTLMRVPLRRDRMQWVEAATADAIRQFADGIGDDNPLWRDPEYAGSTRWQGLLAPPAFLYAVDATIVAPKLPGVQWIYAGTRWRWLDAIRVNQPFAATAQLVAMEEKQGRRFGRWVLQTGEIEYRAPSGELLAIAEGRVARTPRASSGTKRGESKPKPERADATAPSEPKAKQANANTAGKRPKRRGDEPRYFEDVHVGEQLGPDPRPLSLVDIYRWYVGAQGALHYGGAHADAVRAAIANVREFETIARPPGARPPGAGLPERAKVVRVLPDDGADIARGEAILELEPA